MGYEPTFADSWGSGSPCSIKSPAIESSFHFLCWTHPFSMVLFLSLFLAFLRASPWFTYKPPSPAWPPTSAPDPISLWQWISLGPLPCLPRVPPCRRKPMMQVDRASRWGSTVARGNHPGQEHLSKNYSGSSSQGKMWWGAEDFPGLQGSPHRLFVYWKGKSSTYKVEKIDDISCNQNECSHWGADGFHMPLDVMCWEGNTVT